MDRMKRNIYITRDLEIKRDGNILKVGNKKLPLSIVNNVFIIGNAKITRSAQNLILKNSKAIFFLNYKYDLVGILTPPFFKSDYSLRVKQYQNLNSVELAKFVIEKKIIAIENYLKKSLNRHKEKLKSTNSLDEILGIEGSCSSYMFRKFRENLENIGITEFKKREYRPVKDRVNGLLSFLYSMYYAFLFSEVISLGFDPYAGIVHKKRGKHAVFVSDMMEEARIYLTKLAFLILKEIYDRGFDGLYLNNEARKYVVKEFDEFLISYENSLLREFKEKLLIL